MASILEHVTFSTLDEDQKIRVRAYVKAPKLSELDTYEIFKHQHELTMPLDFWDNQVSTTKQFVSNAADFNSLSLVQIELLRDQLSFAFYIFNARYKLALDHGLGHELGDAGDQIQDCADLIKLLNGHVTIDTMPTVSDDGIDNLLKWIRYWNERRLYWVWAGRGGLLGSTISLLPDGFYNKKQALEALDVPVPLTGGSSWALYYFRSGIILGRLFRHTVAGSWMSEGEKKIPWKERFAMELDKSKFDFINDFFWANGNLACFFWLCGNAVADYYGGALTTLLLLMDVSVTIWSYSESYAQYSKDMERFKAGINKLMQDEALNHLQIKALRDAMCQCKLEWDYKLFGLYTDILYAVSLMLSFTLLYCGFLPLAAVSAGAAVFWGMTGTVLCFTLNACFAAIRQVLSISESVELSNSIAKDFLNTPGETFDSNRLKSEWSYHQKMIEYKQACLVRTVLIDLIVPPVVFLSFVFLPLSIGLPIVAAGFLLAVASYYYVDKYYQHDITCVPKQSVVAELPSPVITHGFFGKVADVLQDHSTPVWTP